MGVEANSIKTRNAFMVFEQKLKSLTSAKMDTMQKQGSTVNGQLRST